MKERDAAGRKDAREVLGPRFEEVLAAALRPVALPPERAARLRARVLARIESDPHTRRDLVTVREGQGSWTEILPAVERKVLFEDPAARTRSVLIRLRPGARIPPHGHAIDEECYVIEGALSIGTLLLRSGDYHVAPAGTPHPAIHSADGALVFLREEIRDAPAP